MARTVGDLALMLTAIARRDPRSPLSFLARPSFDAELVGSLAGVRIGWCPDLGGLPIEPDVIGVLARARDQLTALGCVVEDVDLDLSAADEAFETLRAVGFARRFGDELATIRGTTKQTVVWNTERGLALDGPAVARAIALRSEVFATVAGALQKLDLLVAPSAQVVPFPVEDEYPTEIAGVEMPHYLGWMRVCSRLTVSAHPIAAVPAGFTTDGLPVGMQLVGRYGDDRRLLELAAAWHLASGLAERHPPLD
jgi:amidase